MTLRMPLPKVATTTGKRKRGPGVAAVRHALACWVVRGAAGHLVCGPGQPTVEPGETESFVRTAVMHTAL